MFAVYVLDDQTAEHSCKTKLFIVDIDGGDKFVSIGEHHLSELHVDLSVIPNFVSIVTDP